ncbi:crotonobetainyl-CoA:carnitine CoA-transferase CaiB-like acyl-CoA transferase [Paraburkholderia caballeronis]|uniref:CaiB/BaiF CoA transferase family protein n=1 Tax=Paraburkholderia caballeronis TaxID=416943 RepID=UPI001064D19A|nr:CaiB/BaiF CoA-transferase family protein [Paraburkholderia caballeronis]TDV35610.1 crotonobetainyl-CoA:carnitine CoA-transferase CaiB-like acyl-CoA transferase [Paraburkholderia caballeronis]
MALETEAEAGSVTGGALAGLKVLDIATFVAAPFCGTILADFGADVIKIEQPKTGDSLRQFGTVTECGDSLVWLSESRNKKTVTLDLRQPAGADMFRRLVAQSDVVLENFRPGTLERWGLGFDALSEINPRLIMLRISAYGQTGPKREEPGFARIAHAFAGLSWLAGERDGPPVVPGSTSMADYISGMWGAIGVLTAVQARIVSGRGQFIDIGLYESVFRLLDEIAPAYAKYGSVRERMGADTVNVVPHSHYRTASGEWVALACTNDKMFERLAQVMGRRELVERFPTSAVRVEHRDEVNAIVADWVGGCTLRDVLERTREGGVPCAQIYSIREIFEDPQYEARGNLLRVDDPRVGELVVPAPVPRMSATPAQFRHAGRALGADNHEVYSTYLGLSDDELRSLAETGVI